MTRNENKKVLLKKTLYLGRKGKARSSFLAGGFFCTIVLLLSVLIEAVRGATYS
jgi:hypothetical protein